MEKLKENVDKLDLEELKQLLNSSREEVIGVVIEQLRYLSEYGKTDKIALEAFNLGKDRFGSERLKYLSIYGKTNEIALEAFNLGRDRFSLEQLKNLYEHSRVSEIKNETKKLIEKPININDYM